MGRIKQLDDQLVNRIAAGEVVERPASVVKELVENALDAGSTRIEIDVDGGGKRGIRVGDDGEGMDAADALLALERHATSKLESIDDLLHIQTLGFRGEALSSIASVSRVVLRTAVRDGDGVEVECVDGAIRSVRDVALPRGTRVRVERLFQNVPARRKFLRSESTELSHIVKMVTRYALVNFAVRFRLATPTRTLLDLTVAETPRQRLAQTLGSEVAERMLPFEERGDGLHVWGFAGRPAQGRPRRDAQHLFVNGRAVQDRMLTHALSLAYENTMPRGRFPEVVLFVEIDPEAVDVNVHPQKTEVRFRESGSVHQAVARAVRGALSGGAAVPSLTDLRPGSVPTERADRVADAALAYLAAERDAPPRAPLGTPPGAGSAAARVPVSRPPDQESLPAMDEAAVPSALGQFRDSYIVAEDRDGLMLVDQHAAQERVLFERYLEEAERNTVQVQALLFPVTVDLAPHELVLVEREGDELLRLGFRVAVFGGSTVRIDGVPSLAAKVEPGRLLREVLGYAARTKAAAAGVAELRRKLVTSAACQAAIKINHPLTMSSMQQLLTDLAATANPTTCPHGRPAIFRLTLDEIERAFRRR